MKSRTMIAVLALAVLTWSQAAFAHGAGKHVMGTVESVSADHLVVKDRSGNDRDLTLDTKTRYRDGAGAAAAASDLRAGDRVVVHLGEKESSTAVEVRFSHVK